MPIEQPAAAPEAESSVDQRLVSFFAKSGAEPKISAESQPENQAVEPEAASAEVEVDPDQPVEGEDAGQPIEAQAESDPFVDVSDDAGSTHKVPAALKDAFLRQSDYTKKSQEVATLRRSAEDKIAFAEAKEQIFGTVLQDVVGLRETQSQLAQLQALDWASLYNADPGQALNLRSKLDSLRSREAEQQQAIASKAQQFESARKKHSETQWTLAVEGVKAKIGSVTPAEDNAMLKTVQDLGFTQEELTGRFADPRFLQAIYMASKSASLASKKPAALAAISKAPPIVKPGAVQQGAVAQNRYREQRAVLKKTGSTEDAAKLILMRSKGR